MIIEGCASLESYFLKFINEEFRNLMDNDFKDVFKDVPYKVSIGWLSCIDHAWDTICRYKTGHLTREYIRNKFKYLHRIEYTTCFESIIDAIEKDGLITIKRLMVIVRVDALNKTILDNISNLERVKEWIKVVLRHEIGHLIHYKIFHNAPLKEYTDTFKQRHDELDEFEKWVDSLDEVDPDEYLRRYHSITMEAMADAFGGITVDDVIANEPRIPSDEGCKYEIKTL